MVRREALDANALPRASLEAVVLQVDLFACDDAGEERVVHHVPVEGSVPRGHELLGRGGFGVIGKSADGGGAGRGGRQMNPAGRVRREKDIVEGTGDAARCAEVDRDGVGDEIAWIDEMWESVEPDDEGAMRVRAVTSVGENGLGAEAERPDEVQEGGGEGEAGPTGPKAFEIREHDVWGTVRRTAGVGMSQDFAQVFVGKSGERGGDGRKVRGGFAGQSQSEKRTEFPEQQGAGFRWVERSHRHKDNVRLESRLAAAAFGIAGVMSRERRTRRAGGAGGSGRFRGRRGSRAGARPGPDRPGGCGA